MNSTTMTIIGAVSLFLVSFYDLGALHLRTILTFFSFMYYSFVHGRLPYENLKPDHVLRNLLLSLPVRKVVSFLQLKH